MLIYNNPAAVLGGHLVIADVHLGITRQFAAAGIHMPSQTSLLIERIRKLKRLTRTKGLVIVGDLKHKVPGISAHEQREIPHFLAELAKRFEKIVIIKGNHDGNIEQLIPQNLKNRIKVKKEMIIERCLLTHGHKKVRARGTLIIGHNHPHIQLTDKLGARYIEPVWICGRYKGFNLIIMPAFNPLCGATIVNKDVLLGPIAKRLHHGRALLLDGTDLGVI